MPQNLTDEKLTLVQVIAWCRQATSHYLNQCWPRSPTPYGVIDIIIMVCVISFLSVLIGYFIAGAFISMFYFLIHALVISRPHDEPEMTLIKTCIIILS